MNPSFYSECITHVESFNYYVCTYGVRGAGGGVVVGVGDWAEKGLSKCERMTYVNRGG